MADGRLAPESPFARPLGPVAAAAWSAAFLMIFVFIGSVVAAMKPGSEVDNVTVALLYVASVLIVLLILVRVHAPEAELRDVVGARPLGFLSAFVAAAMGACAYFPLGAFEAFITRRFVDPQHLVEYERLLSNVGRTERVAGIVAYTLVVPIADELFFRGAIATGVLRDRGRASAAATTAVTFALVSSANDLHYLPLFVAMGLLLVHARLSTGSVLAALAAHFGYRGAELAHAFRAHRTIDPLVTGATAARLPPKILIAAGVLSLLLALLLARLGAGEPLPSKRSSLPPPSSGEDDA